MFSPSQDEKDSLLNKNCKTRHLSDFPIKTLENWLETKLAKILKNNFRLPYEELC
jgi:hypothetical protein